MQNKHLPITSDGHFLAYKAVNNKFMDKYTGTVDNSIGQKPTMTRFGVDDDRNNGCSSGLHAGTLDYVQSYGSFCEDDERTDRCIIVKINPEDVVSVPLDCECQKLRTTSYEVIKLYEGEMEYTLAGEDGLEWDDEYYDPDLNYSSEDEDWELEDYMDEEESSEVTSSAGLTFQVDTSDLDSFKDRWMNN